MMIPAMVVIVMKMIVDVVMVVMTNRQTMHGKFGEKFEFQTFAAI